MNRSRAIEEHSAPNVEPLKSTEPGNLQPLKCIAPGDLGPLKSTSPMQFQSTQPQSSPVALPQSSGPTTAEFPDAPDAEQMFGVKTDPGPLRSVEPGNPQPLKSVEPGDRGPLKSMPPPSFGGVAQPTATGNGWPDRAGQADRDGAAPERLQPEP